VFDRSKLRTCFHWLRERPVLLLLLALDTALLRLRPGLRPAAAACWEREDCVDATLVAPVTQHAGVPEVRCKAQAGAAAEKRMHTGNAAS
jgi:hypothetical protein